MGFGLSATCKPQIKLSRARVASACRIPKDPFEKPTNQPPPSHTQRHSKRPAEPLLHARFIHSGRNVAQLPQSHSARFLENGVARFRLHTPPQKYTHRAAQVVTGGFNQLSLCSLRHIRSLSLLTSPPPPPTPRPIHFVPRATFVFLFR